MRARFVLAFLGAAAAAQGAHAQTAFALTARGELYRFDIPAPDMLTRLGFVAGAGLPLGFRAIDFRPHDGRLYLLAEGAKSAGLYLFAPDSASAVFHSVVDSTLLGSTFGFDFDPRFDRARITSEDRQNLSVNPDTGATTIGGVLRFAQGDPNQGGMPFIVGSAYTNSAVSGLVQPESPFQLAGDGQAPPDVTDTVPVLYGIDSNLDILVRQDGDSGVLHTVGALGINAGALVGFDIAFDGFENTGYATITAPGTAQSSLYSIDLNTGAATFLAALDTPTAIIGFAVLPAEIPEPGAATLLILAALAPALSGRRQPRC